MSRTLYNHLIDATSKIISQFGDGIVYEERFVNILSDMFPDRDNPAILRIIKSAILARLLKGVFNSNAENIGVRVDAAALSLSKQYGYDQKLVKCILSSLAVGYGTISTAQYETLNNLRQKQMKNNSIQPFENKGRITSGLNTIKTNSISYEQIVATQFLVMKVSPIHASVYIDGSQQFVSNGIMAVELPVGQHSYKVEAEFYDSQCGIIEINDNVKIEKNIILTPQKKYVQLNIVSEDKDAEIIINGATYGIGAWGGLVEEGIYEIELRKNRYYSYKQSISLYGEKEMTISIPPLKAICGNLKVNVQPYGSNIYINKKYIGKTPLLVKDVLIGERKVTIRTDEGTKYETIVEVKENQTTDIEHLIPTLFIYDYSKIKLGDYFYEDGSFSHEQIIGCFKKKLVGVVFNLNTSKEEKSHGWTHGQIISVENIKISGEKTFAWGIASKDLLENAVSDPLNSIDNGYKITHLESVFNNPDFETFILASRYDAKLPFGTTSGWYLPCIAQWRILHKYLRDTHYDGNVRIHVSGGSYSSCSIFDKEEAWKFQELLYEDGRSFCKSNISNYTRLSYLGNEHIRAVASF